MRKRLQYSEWKSISSDEREWLKADMLYEILERLEANGIKVPTIQDMIRPARPPPPAPKPRPITTISEDQLEAKIAELEERLANLNKENQT